MCSVVMLHQSTHPLCRIDDDLNVKVADFWSNERHLHGGLLQAGQTRESPCEVDGTRESV